MTKFEKYSVALQHNEADIMLYDGKRSIEHVEAVEAGRVRPELASLPAILL